MILSSKHAERQQPLIRADFSGGLNTAATVEEIAENQLAETLNLEIDAATGKLCTVAGTVDILRAENIFAAIYDSINSLILVVKTDRKIYLADFEGNVQNKSVGSLSGNLYPKYAAWEDGVLIASGGALQYFDGANLKTLTSPQAENVFVRNGRVVICNEKNLHYSGVGDENFWQEDNNVESVSKFVEIGYKDGAKIVGAASLSQDILILKSNKNCYRLGGEFPNWQINKIAENVECSGRLSYCAVGDDVFILGANEVQQVQNAFYGNVKPEDLAAQINSEIHRLPQNSQVKFVNPLWQVWFIGSGGAVLVFDIRFKAWFKRQFNAEIIDVFTVADEVFIVKADRISKLDKGTFKDNDEYLSWKFLAQRLVSHHDYLLKRTKITITPLNHEYYCGQISVGKVVIALPIPKRAVETYENESPIFYNQTKIHGRGRLRGEMLPQLPNEDIFKNKNQPLREKVFANNKFELVSKNVYRSHYLDIAGEGRGGRFILNSIVMDIAEV